MLFTSETVAVAARMSALVLEARAPIVQAPEARVLGLTEGQIITALAGIRGERLKLILQGRGIDLPRGLRLKEGDTVVLKAHAQTNGQWQLQPVSVNGQAVKSAATLVGQGGAAINSVPSNQEGEAIEPIRGQTPRQDPSGLPPRAPAAGAADTPAKHAHAAVRGAADPARPEKAPAERALPREKLLPTRQFLAQNARSLPPVQQDGVAPSKAGANAPKPLAQADTTVPARLNALIASTPEPLAWARLFKSDAFSQLLAMVSGLPNRRADASATAPRRPIVSQTFDQWPMSGLRMRSLTPEGLRNALLASGLSAEAMLVRGEKKAGTDGKSLLRQLLSVAKLGSEAHTVVKDALDEIQRVQVDAAQALDRRELAFSLVLPFADADPVSFKFHRKGKRDDLAGNVYTVDVHTQSRRLGDLWMRSKIDIQRERTDVALTMWIPRADVAKQAQAQLGALRAELEAAGLGLVDAHVLQSARPQGAASDAETRLTPGNGDRSVWDVSA